MRRTNETLLVARVMLLDDRRAFAVLVEQHHRAIRRFFLHHTAGDEMLSDDLAQETFIRLYYSIKQFKGLSSFSTYLYRIAYNIYQDHLRRLKPTQDAEQIPDEAYTTGNDLHMDIIHALSQLSHIERTIVTLYYIEDRKVNEIARILQQPTGTVKSHLSRARAKLSTFLKNNGYD